MFLGVNIRLFFSQFSILNSQFSIIFVPSPTNNFIKNKAKKEWQNGKKY